MKNLFIKKQEPKKIEEIMATLFPEHTAEEWKKLFPVEEEKQHE